MEPKTILLLNSTLHLNEVLRMGIRVWRPRLWNLLENKRTPLIRAHMRQQPQNVLECACEGASAQFPANQYCESALWLTNQIAAATSVYGPVSCDQTHFPLSASCVAFHLPVRHLSHPAVPSSLLYSYVLVTVNTQSLQPTLAFSLAWGTAYTRDGKRILPEISVPRFIVQQSARRDLYLLNVLEYLIY